MPLPTRLRLCLICFVALSVSLPMAWISLGKLVLFVTCLVYLVTQLMHQKSDLALNQLWSARLIVLTLALFALSLSWSEAPQDVAVMAFAKHGKLLEIFMLVSLIRTVREARLVLVSFLAGQAFFVLSSWLMVVGWRVPWATSVLSSKFKNVVYSTYLDQTLIFSACAAVFWHLRGTWPRLRWIAGLFAMLTVLNVLFFQDGKTGYVAALTVLALAIMWQLPHRWRLAALVIGPVSLALLAYAVAPKLQEKVTQTFIESQNYSAHGDNESSSGFRLHVWKRSLEAIAQRPISGHGVGSWTLAVKRLEGDNAQKVFGNGIASNPHQEFLLWGVELGIGGTLLLLALLACLARDSLHFPTPIRQALLSVLAVMVVACLFNSSLYDALIGDFFCIVLGLLIALGVRSTTYRPGLTSTQHIAP